VEPLELRRCCTKLARAHVADDDEVGRVDATPGGGRRRRGDGENGTEEGGPFRAADAGLTSLRYRFGGPP